MAADHTRYEVTVSFVIEQPNHLQLSQDEVKDNVVMALIELGQIGFAPIDLNSAICADVVLDDEEVPSMAEHYGFDKLEGDG